MIRSNLNRIQQAHSMTLIMRRRLKNKINNQIESLSSKIDHKLNPRSAEKIDEIVRFICDNYCFAATNLDEYVHLKEPPQSRIYIQWMCDLILWATMILFCCIGSQIPSNGKIDPNLFIISGLPFGFMPAKSLQIGASTIILFTLFAASGRLIMIVKERQHEMEIANILFILRDPNVRGKLNVKYYWKMCFLIEMLGDHFIKIYYFCELYMFSSILSLIVYSYLTPDVPFSITMIIGLFVYSAIIWISIPVYYAGFITYFITVRYLKYRFKQVNEKIRDCKSLSILMSAISEHDQICSINQKNNQVTKLILFQVYYLGSVIMDLSLIQSLYTDNIWIIKLLLLGISFFLSVSILIMANESASLSKASKGSYYKLNSIMAKSSLKVRWSRLSIIRAKIKILNLIERLAQTSITVWCLDLFPLNNYELYVFIASVASNFFLFIDVLKPRSNVDPNFI